MFNCVINSTLTASFYKYKEKCIPSISSFFTTIDIPKYFVPLASYCLKLKKKKLFDCNLCRQIACNWFNVLDVSFGEILFIKVQSNFSQASSPALMFPSIIFFSSLLVFIRVYLYIKFCCFYMSQIKNCKRSACRFSAFAYQEIRSRIIPKMNCNK